MTKEREKRRWHRWSGRRRIKRKQWEMDRRPENTYRHAGRQIVRWTHRCRQPDRHAGMTVMQEHTVKSS